MRENAKGVDWKGCCTALVTPFDDKGRIAFGALEELVAWQIKQGIDFLVPCGTTGESATLSRDERKAVTAAVVRAANGRVPVIAGAGGNHTARAVFWARDAAAVKADGILSVTPMYNRPSPEGLVRHFSAIADASCRWLEVDGAASPSLGRCPESPGGARWRTGDPASATTSAARRGAAPGHRRSVVGSKQQAVPVPGGGFATATAVS